MKQKRFCAPTVIHGLLEIQKVRDKFKAQNIQLTYAESIKIGNLDIYFPDFVRLTGLIFISKTFKGLPFNLKCDQKEDDKYYDKNCDNSKVITDEELR